MTKEQLDALVVFYTRVQESAEEVKKIFTSDLEYTSPELYNATVSLAEQAEALVEAIEDADENLDPEKTKIPSIEEFFKGNKTSEYVQALIDHHEGKKTIQEVRKKAQEIEPTQLPEGMESIEQLKAYVELLDEDYTTEVNDALTWIEQTYKGVADFDKTDVGVLRFYLSHCPYVYKADVDICSDDQIILAYKKQQLLKGNL
jgi:hypothetical protein